MGILRRILIKFGVRMYTGLIYITVGLSVGIFITYDELSGFMKGTVWLSSSFSSRTLLH
jgi:hypothetical protein